MESKAVIKSSYWSMNLLEDEGIKLFYSTQEAIQAYLSCFEIIIKRGIAFQVEETLELFLNYPYSKEKIEFLTELLRHKNNEMSKIQNIDQGMYKLLKELYPEGIKLLEIPYNINTEILKRLYRKAVLRYHPDRGGTHEKMIQVSEAFSIYHNALTNFIPSFENNRQSSGRLRSSPESWDDWLYSVYLVLACINGDFFATDKAFPYLKDAYRYASKSPSNYIGNFARDIFGLSGGVLSSTCRALARFKMKEELNEASKITSYLIDRMFESGVFKNEVGIIPERKEYPSEKDFIKEYGTKLVINHPEKAKNAYRLGQIDKERFQQAMNKFNMRALSEEEVISKINDFMSKNEIISRLSDADYNIKSNNPKIIAPPSFFQERFDHLDDDQKWEYLNTWKKGGNGKLAIKYYDIRTQEIMLGLVHNYDSFNHKLLKEEIDFFSSNFGKKFWKYLIVSDFFVYLRNLDAADRREKLLLLKEIDDPEPRSFSLTIIISLDAIKQKNYKKRISVDDDYIEFTKMSINEIKRFQTTGECYGDYHLAWNRDINNLNTFQKSKIGNRKDRIWLATNNPSPEQVIESSKPYIEGLLDLGKKFHPKNTGQLQIGYEINRLTAAYGKLKQWDEVVYWCELFFNLPSNYRDRSSDEELEKIRKRLERAKKNIQTR